MKLVRVDECVFVFVESACAYWLSEDCNRGREGGRVGRNLNNSRGRRFRTFFYQADTQRGVLLLGVMSVLWLRYSEGYFGE